MTNKALSSHSPGLSFRHQSPPLKKKASPRPEAEQDQSDAFVKGERKDGGFWKKAALFGVAGLGLIAGARTLLPSGPTEVAVTTETATSNEVTPESLQKEQVGLAAVPSDWIPSGTSDGFATSPFGGARGTTERSPQKIFLDLHGSMEPDLTLTDLGEGRVEAYVDLPGPFDQKSVGTLERDGDQLVYRAENGKTSATIRKAEDGKLEATLKRKGWSDWNLSYKGY